MNTTVMPVAYGAPEIQRVIHRNTWRAWVTITSLLLLFGASLLVYKWIMDTWYKPLPVVEVVITRTMVENTAPPQSDDAPPEPPPMEAPSSLAGPAATAGIPVPVPDALIPEDALKFADLGDIDNATSKGGDGSDPGSSADWGSGGGGGNTLQIENREEVPNEDDFISYTKDVAYDDIALQKSVQYPETARELGIQGKVNLRVLINANGTVQTVKVLQSDHSILEASAIKAVKNFNGYTPAIQGDKPVISWTNIIINYTLGR